jgi:hypothetical protein
LWERSREDGGSTKEKQQPSSSRVCYISAADALCALIGVTSEKTLEVTSGRAEKESNQEKSRGTELIAPGAM